MTIYNIARNHVATEAIPHPAMTRQHDGRTVLYTSLVAILDDPLLVSTFGEEAVDLLDFAHITEFSAEGDEVRILQTRQIPARVIWGLNDALRADPTYLDDFKRAEEAMRRRGRGCGRGVPLDAAGQQLYIHDDDIHHTLFKSESGRVYLPSDEVSYAGIDRVRWEMPGNLPAIAYNEGKVVAILRPLGRTSVFEK